MSFKFAYKSVLFHRKRLQEMASKEYADALTVLSSEKNKLERLYTASTSALEFRFQTEVGGGLAEVLKSVDTFTKGQVHRIKEQKEVVKQHQQRVEKKQEALRKAQLSYKIMERLEEKKKEEFVTEKKKRETKEMDDIVSMRAARRDLK